MSVILPGLAGSLTATSVPSRLEVETAMKLLPLLQGATTPPGLRLPPGRRLERVSAPVRATTPPPPSAPPRPTARVWPWVVGASLLLLAAGAAAWWIRR